MVCWSTLETLACVSQVLHKVGGGYPVLSLPHMHSSCIYFTFQSRFPLWGSNRIQAFKQPFKRWLLSTLCRISMVHPQTEMMVSLSITMLMLVSYSSFALFTAYYLQHPPKETFTKWLRTLHNQCTFCFCFALPLLVTRNISTTQGRYFGWCLVQVVLSKKSGWLEMMGLEMGIHGATSGLPPVNPCSIPPCLPQLPNWPCITLPGGWVMRNRRLETSQPASARPLKSC